MFSEAAETLQTEAKNVRSAARGACTFTSRASQEPDAEKIDVTRKDGFLKWLLQGEEN